MQSCAYCCQPHDSTNKLTDAQTKIATLETRIKTLESEPLHKLIADVQICWHGLKNFPNMEKKIRAVTGRKT